MCDPTTITIASGVMLAAGTGMKMMQNNAIADANNKAQQAAAAASQKARADELLRQQGFQTERNQLFATDVNQAGAADTTSRLGDAITNRVNDYTSRVPLTGGSLDAPVYANAAVVGDAKSTLAQALAGSRDRLRARAALEGYGDVADQNKRGLLASGTRFGTLGGLAAGSLSASKLEQGIQPGAYTSSMGVGDILQTAGTAGLGSSNRLAGWAGYTEPVKA